jgi:Holliday junction resolvase RusA-like endonuclease
MEINFAGSYSSCDLDNLCGAIMDGLQKAFIIKNDNTKHINRLVLSHTLTEEHQVSISLTTP